MVVVEKGSTVDNVEQRNRWRSDDQGDGGRREDTAMVGEET